MDTKVQRLSPSGGEIFHTSPD